MSMSVALYNNENLLNFKVHMVEVRRLNV
jgi:hypothetical protein